MKHTIFSLTILLLFSAGYGQTTTKELIKKPAKSSLLRLPSSDGTNGSAVAWNPETSTYFCVIAGNESFPIDVFSATGSHLQTIEARMDLRGFWHNPVYGLMEGNTHNYHDIASYVYLKNGKLDEGDEPLIELYELPVIDPQAVMAYDVKKNRYIWFDLPEAKIKFINPETGMEDGEVTLKLPTAKENLNSTTVAYTGVEGAEYALLNFNEKKVYLFNGTTGALAFTMQLPKDAVTHDLFRFAYANNHVWLYDVSTRTWTGYAAVKQKK